LKPGIKKACRLALRSFHTSKEVLKHWKAHEAQKIILSFHTSKEVLKQAEGRLATFDAKGFHTSKEVLKRYKLEVGVSREVVSIPLRKY